ncbi:MAG: hypothetical protein ACTSV7_06710 [Candidatus Baldrarchaeia archaeon]
MAIRVDTQDLVNYPGTIKVVTLDQDSIVPVGYEGDEQYVLSFSTTAYSDIANSTAIQTLYMNEIKTGWCKSSGFKGSNNKFELDATHYKMKIKLDATVSGSDDSGYYEILLDYNLDSTPIDGEAIAADMEEKIRAVTCVTADTGFQLSYKSCSVEFTAGKFWIIPGSIGNFYTGSNRSSAVVTTASTDDCSALLGFDLQVTSVALAAVSVKEAVLAANYSTNTSPMTIGAGTGVVAGDALVISDGANTDYFTAISGTTDTSVVVATIPVYNYTGVVNDYVIGDRVQKLRYQDPDRVPVSYYSDIDAIHRFGTKYLINQIDYSS